MSNPKTSSRAATTATALVVAGLFSATASFALLNPSSTQNAVVKDQNPVVSQALKKAKSLQRKGKWTDSALLIKEFATPENPTALLEYAKLLSRGWGVGRDLDKAREKLLLAVQQDFSKRGEAAFELAKVYRRSSGADCARIAFEWFTKAADWGFYKAHVELGRHHLRGIAVPVNSAKALREFQIAARHGSATALLSFLNLVSKNPKLGRSLPPINTLLADAIPMLEQEALQGKASSAKALGRLYKTGDLIPANPIQAKVWLRRGADLGDTGAMCDLALFLLEGLPSDQEITDALGLMRTATRLNNSGAITEFGRLHLKGQFGLKPSDAVALFKRGTDAAHPGSMLELAKLYLEGTLVKQDRAKAISLLKRGAALGHTGSKTLLQKTLSAKAAGSEVSSKSKKDALRITKKLNRMRKQKPIKKKSNEHPLSGATVITPFGRKG